MLIPKKFIRFVFALLLLGMSLSACSSEPESLTVLHISDFKLSPARREEFEKAHHAKLKLIPFGTDALMLAHAKTNASENGDVLLGVGAFKVMDDTRFAQPVRNVDLSHVSAHVQDPSNGWLPMDISYVTLAYDKIYFANRNLQPPQTLRDLQQKAFFHRFVFPDPRQNDVGFAMLALSVAQMPEGGAYTWQQFWRELKPNIIHTTPTWAEAFSQQFTATGNKDMHPMCASYLSAPAAEVQFGRAKEPSFANVNFAYAMPRYMAVRAGTTHTTLAEKFVVFVLSESAQRDIPTQSLSYPARDDVPLPEVFAAFAPLPAHIFSLPLSQIAQNKTRWLGEWQRIVYDE